MRLLLLLVLSVVACAAGAAAPEDLDAVPAAPERRSELVDGSPLLAVPGASPPASPRLVRDCEDCEFHLVGAFYENPELTEVCQRFFDHLDACGFGVSPSREDCPRIARLASGVTARYFNCVLRSDCTPNPPHCDIPPSTLGAELEAARATRCIDAGAMSETRRGLLDDLGGQRSPAASDVARACVAEQSCDAIEPCLDAWLDL